MKNVLSIAGSDSCGGAGIQADLKTFAALGVYGMSVITAVTAQNTTGVSGIRELDAEIVRAQIDSLFADIRVDAVKIGMVSGAAIIEAIAGRLEAHRAVNIVVDPVMISKSGSRLLQPDAAEALIRALFPLALVVTPNLLEAGVITGREVTSLAQMEQAAADIRALGARNVVAKGGHLRGDAVDVFYDGERFYHLEGRRIDTKNTHGTGCTFSSAIAACLALGFPVVEAVRQAKEYITGAVEHSYDLGHGAGPVGHFYRLFGSENKPD